MFRSPKIVAALLALVILAIPMLAVASTCPAKSATAMPCCPMGTMAGQGGMMHESGPMAAMMVPLQVADVSNRSCCCEAIPNLPAPAQTLQSPSHAVTLTAPVLMAVAMPFLPRERAEHPPQFHPDTGISPQAVLCTFLI